MTEPPRGRTRSLWSFRPLPHLWPLAILLLGGCQQDYRDRDSWPMCALPGATSAQEIAWLSPTNARTIIVGGNPIFTATAWVSAIVPTADGAGFLVLGDGEATLLRREGDGWGTMALGRLSSRVRAAVTDPSGAIVVITGGQTQPALRETESADEPTPWLMRGQVGVAALTGQTIECHGGDVPAEWNPFRLKAGRFAGEDSVLVFVYKRTPFDAVARRRPFIFRAGVDRRLEPRWRGSAFSHPFVDADFGDFTGAGEGEIAALEVGSDGGRLLTAYHFEGFGLEGLAPTIELPEVEDRLVAADVVCDDRAELIVLAGGDHPAFVAWGLTAGDEPELVEVARAVAPEQVIAWTVAMGGVVWLGPDGLTGAAGF